jgi:hypothetical protein
VWAEILLWLQSEPEATAKPLLGKLQEKYPGEYPASQLRTLQRRVKEWRRVMARQLGFGGPSAAAGGEAAQAGEVK